MTTIATAPVPLAERLSRHPLEVVPGLYRQSTGISNAYLVRLPETDDWVLIDAGAEGHDRRLILRSRELFSGRPPLCVLLTHAHFDHAGSLPDLLRHWHVPVYAHPLEFPYLVRHAHYPPGDPTVGGFQAQLSRFMYTSRPTDLPIGVLPLPADGTVPHLPGWRWLATPGHTPGHVSFFEPVRKTLVAGDAVVTLNTDSLFDTVLQTPRISHPPAYATYDWDQAEQSIRALAELLPFCLAPGHGVPLHGHHVADDLLRFAGLFHRPRYGRYVREPVRFSDHGVLSLPPKVPDTVKQVTLTVLVAVLAGTLLYRLGKHARR